MHQDFILHHGFYWINLANKHTGFYSDVKNHTTGKLYTHIQFNETVEKDRISLMQYCAEQLHKKNLFLKCKMANTDRNRGSVPLLFYSYTHNKEEVRQNLKNIYRLIQNDPNNPFYFMVEKKLINFIWRWKLDSKTYEQLQNNTHWSVRHNK